MGDARLGNRIRAFRKLKGYTQQSLAEEMGVSLALVGSLERGTKTPSERVLRKIASTLQVELEELCAITDKKGL
ncbi:helix-turn-helix domain-containing protein [Brevibacillus humidisoli]|uniref:helix-turn-helix transcriptional regulator n=1 Tax=Brevibacillus humidisoli TaxID=2895522 RepID=UPI001E5C0557|nr:helix-turn-helix transcriptional regulator [Brevibacillus humidisoli]UFJ40614.1 helix-turn-helix domain-containing protein [Brevibacillus humidisoli]